MKFTRWLIVPALILPCFARGSLRGGVDDEKSPLARIPADARIVIQLRGIERTKERLVTMIQTDAPNLGPRAQAHFEGLIRMALKGRFQKGLARDGPHFMVYLESPKPGNEQVNLGFLLSVANYEEFLAGWLQPDEKEAVKREPGGFDTVVAGKEAFYLIDRHDYVVLSQRREFVTRLAKTQAGLNTILSKEQTRKFLDADLSVYVDVGTVNKELGKGDCRRDPRDQPVHPTQD